MLERKYPCCRPAYKVLEGPMDPLTRTALRKTAFQMLRVDWFISHHHRRLTISLSKTIHIVEFITVGRWLPTSAGSFLLI